MENDFKYGQDHLTVNLALKIVRGQINGVLTEETKIKIEKNYNVVQDIANGEGLVYSINTGFGSLCTTRISKEEVGKLQSNLLKSHSVGVGSPINKEIAKLMLILKVHALSMGYSGISLNLIERILWHINNDFIPLVPEQGSVGASGDLAPLAHLFLPLIGLGFLSKDGKNYKPAIDFLNQNGLKPLVLHAKEGLALINGTQFITAHGVIVAEKTFSCLEQADLIGAMTLEGYLGSPQPFNERLIALRPHDGAKTVAKRIRKFLKNSQFVESHADCGRVQDPYSIRCIPQVHGASRDAFSHLSEKLECELNSVTDNPIVFDKDTAISGGNFHGQPLALPLDYISLAASELGNISDRRTYLLLEGKWGLPPYLIQESGLNSGFMITQYCSAALASENKTMCFPASADSIPTSMGQEDHVSMGANAATKTKRIIDNVCTILAIELMNASQGLYFRSPVKTSPFLQSFIDTYRKEIPFIEDDKVMRDEIIKSEKFIHYLIIESEELFG